MPPNPRPAHGPITNRADLDIELARLTLRVDRATAHVVEGTFGTELRERQEALQDWYTEIGEALVARTTLHLRRYAAERVRAIAAQCPSLAGADADRAAAPDTPGAAPDRRLH